MRTTIKISELIELVNERNKRSTCAPEVREGWNSLLATVLHDSGVYDGFSYLTQKEVPKGQRPGIIASETPGIAWEFPDKTRIFYYKSRKLQSKKRE